MINSSQGGNARIAPHGHTRAPARNEAQKLAKNLPMARTNSLAGPLKAVPSAIDTSFSDHTPPASALHSSGTCFKIPIRGDGAEAVIARNEAEAAELEMAHGNKLYPLTMGFYVRGEDLPELRTNINRLNALLISNGLQPITEEADLLALDSYVRNLPMAYDLNLDKVSRRARLVFSRHAANLLPLYGRSRGTGHPGLAFFNRGAEPLVFDPLHPRPQEGRAIDAKIIAYRLDHCVYRWCNCA